ncbi:MAG: hypothetical protein M3Q15_05995 [Pseudomonadota bacterium]|nr:hypothetical protein [Pseudomonadota bacterium]
MSIELNCAQCGNNRFSFPKSMTDGTAIVCEDCGFAIGTYAELKDRIGEEVSRRGKRR